MQYTNKKKYIKEILEVYIINSITKSYILNIKIRPLVTEYVYFGHSWSYFDIQNLRLVILYILDTVTLISLKIAEFLIKLSPRKLNITFQISMRV